MDSKEIDDVLGELIKRTDITQRLKKLRKVFPKMESQEDEQMQIHLRLPISAKESLKGHFPLEVHTAMARMYNVSYRWFLFGQVVTDRDQTAESALEVHRDPHD